MVLLPYALVAEVKGNTEDVFNVSGLGDVKNEERLDGELLKVSDPYPGDS